LQSKLKAVKLFSRPRRRGTSQEARGDPQRRASNQLSGQRVAQAPHPVAVGKEGSMCPITGAIQGLPHEDLTTAEAKAAMDADPDIAEERRAFDRVELSKPNVPKASVSSTLFPRVARNTEPKFVRLNVVSRAHRANADTKRLVRQLGGVPALQAFTENFYEKCFADPHIDKFLASHADPHGHRFASWIAEKLGDGTPWTEERRTRAVRTMQLGNRVVEVAFDRSSAHHAAWHSPKREPEKWGDHFKLDDARVWMRLHFWAARDVGLFEHPEFMDYYIRLIGHFVSIYSSKSPMFTRDSARWSADPANIQRYLNAGRMMHDVIGKTLEVAVRELPEDEQGHTGSGHSDPSWPYSRPSTSAWLRCSS